MSQDLAANRVFAPGSIIGIVGGGHLARMSAVAAGSLGFRVHLLSPSADAGALARFAKSVDLVLVAGDEGAAAVDVLEGYRAVHPASALVERARGEAARLGAAEDSLEAYEDYEEVSVLVARNADGQIAVYDPALTHHMKGRFDTSEAPAPLESQLCERVIQGGRALAKQLNLVGLLSVESRVGAGGRVQTRRLGLGVSAAGLWTLDACHTDQFEQWIRATCNLPLGSPRRHSDALTQSLIGPIGQRWAQVLGDEPEARLYLYGESLNGALQPMPGVETGHITRLSERTLSDYSFLGAR